MNQRIKELIKDAGGAMLDEDGQEMTPLLLGIGLEKFAELLVKEFSQQIQIEGRFGLEREQTLIRLCCEKAEKHFGVE